MQSVLPYLAILIVILTGWGIFKKLQVTTLLLFSGLALNLLAVLGGVDGILPRGAKTTGWIGFDLFEQLRALSRSQIASTGFIILVAGGFATYMDGIGASEEEAVAASGGGVLWLVAAFEYSLEYAHRLVLRVFQIK